MRCTVCKDSLVSRGTREKRNVFFIDGEIDRLPLNSAMSANRKCAGERSPSGEMGGPDQHFLIMRQYLARHRKEGGECDGNEMERY